MILIKQNTFFMGRTMYVFNWTHQILVQILLKMLSSMIFQYFNILNYKFSMSKPIKGIMKYRIKIKKKGKGQSLSITKKVRLFCAAPPEFITGLILTISGFKWPSKNGSWSYQEKLRFSKCFIVKNAVLFSRPFYCARRLLILWPISPV